MHQALNSRYGATPDFTQPEIQIFVVQTIMQFINTHMHAAAAYGIMEVKILNNQ